MNNQHIGGFSWISLTSWVDDGKGADLNYVWDQAGGVSYTSDDEIEKFEEKKKKLIEDGEYDEAWEADMEADPPPPEPVEEKEEEVEEVVIEEEIPGATYFVANKTGYCRTSDGFGGLPQIEDWIHDSNKRSC